MKYETPDIWKASALFSQGHTCKAEIVGELKNNRNKYLFIFDTESEEEEIQLVERVEKINRGTIEVNLNEFTKAYQTLKNITFR